MYRKLIIMMTAFIMTLSSCGIQDGNVATDGNTPEEKALNFVKKRLNGEKIINSEVVYGKMPSAFKVDEFKKDRDLVYKAALDYRTCKTRGLEEAMLQNEKIIDEAAISVKAKLTDIENVNDKEYLIVLTEIKGKSGRTNGLIAVFDPQTMRLEKWQEITKPIQNNQIMMINVERGKLKEYSLNSNQNPQDLIEDCPDSLSKFILSCNAK